MAAEITDARGQNLPRFSARYEGFDSWISLIHKSKSKLIEIVEFLGNKSKINHLKFKLAAKIYVIV